MLTRPCENLLHPCLNLFTVVAYPVIPSLRDYCTTTHPLTIYACAFCIRSHTFIIIPSGVFSQLPHVCFKCALFCTHQLCALYSSCIMLHTLSTQASHWLYQVICTPSLKGTVVSVDYTYILLHLLCSWCLIHSIYPQVNLHSFTYVSSYFFEYTYIDGIMSERWMRNKENFEESSLKFFFTVLHSVIITSLRSYWNYKMPLNTKFRLFLMVPFIFQNFHSYWCYSSYTLLELASLPSVQFFL